MFTIDTLVKVLLFLFGTPHNVMYTALTFAGVSFVLDFFRKYSPPKKKKKVFKEFIKKFLAYLSFVIIAARVDSLAVDGLFGWDGSSQFLVCLYVLAREIRLILDYIRSQGIEIPFVLESRVSRIEEHINGAKRTDLTPEMIDQQIASIQQHLQEIEQIRQQNQNGGGVG